MGRRRHERDEGGAALVEAALLLPILMALVLGIFSGGHAYNRKHALTHAAREGSRYGATLPLSQFAAYAPNEMLEWLRRVADITEKSAAGELGDSVASREICVALVYADPDGTNRTRSLTYDPNEQSVATTPCYSDGRPATEKRVQVAVTRDGELDALFYRQDLTLTGRGTTRFEASE